MILRKKIAISLLVFQFSIFNFQFSIECFAQENENNPNHPFSLQQAVDYAMQNQTKVLDAAIDEKIAKAKMHEITGMGFPQIGANIDVKDFTQLPTSLLPGDFFGMPGTYVPVKFGLPYNGSAGIDFSQLIFSASYIVGLQASKTYIELSKKASTRTKIETVAAVTKAYYGVLVNEERIKLLNVNIDKIKTLLNASKVMNENGYVEKIDVDRLSLAYNNLITEKEKIESFIKLSNALLKYQMGMDQSNELTLSDKLEDITFNVDTNSSQKMDYNSRIEYSLMQSQLKLSMLDLKRYRLSSLPSLVMYGSFSQNAQRAEFNFLDASEHWYPTSLIGFKLSIPIFDGSQTCFRTQQAKLAVQKNKNDLIFVQQSIDMELQSSKTTLFSNISTLDMQKKNIALAEEVYRVTKIKYEQGVGSNIEVLNAETSLKESQVNYFSALYDALISKVDYEKAKGQIK